MLPLLVEPLAGTEITLDLDFSAPVPVEEELREGFNLLPGVIGRTVGRELVSGSGSCCAVAAEPANVPITTAMAAKRRNRDTVS